MFHRIYHHHSGKLTTFRQVALLKNCAQSRRRPHFILTMSTSSQIEDGTHQDASVPTVSNASLSSQSLSLPRLYRYLNLETFQPDELETVFNRISDGENEISRTELQGFLLSRISELEAESDELIDENEETKAMRRAFAGHEANLMFQTISNNSTQEVINRRGFCQAITEHAGKVDVQRTWPITASMLLVGSSVGVVTPAMPFVVENLGLTASQYGLVVSAFGLAKMVGNIPSAIAAERHGRKPYMTYSLLVIGCGVGGIGLANSFEGLYACRLLTGMLA